MYLKRDTFLIRLVSQLHVGWQGGVWGNECPEIDSFSASQVGTVYAKMLEKLWRTVGGSTIGGGGFKGSRLKGSCKGFARSIELAAVPSSFRARLSLFIYFLASFFAFGNLVISLKRAWYMERLNIARQFIQKRNASCLTNARAIPFARGRALLPLSEIFPCLSTSTQKEREKERERERERDEMWISREIWLFALALSFYLFRLSLISSFLLEESCYLRKVSNFRIRAFISILPCLIECYNAGWWKNCV